MDEQQIAEINRIRSDPKISTSMKMEMIAAVQRGEYQVVNKPRYGGTPTEGIAPIPEKTYGPIIETKGTVFEGGTKPIQPVVNTSSPTYQINKAQKQVIDWVFMPFSERIETARLSLVEDRFKPGTLEPVPGGNIFESPGMVKVRESNEQAYEYLRRKHDTAGLVVRGASSPLPTVAISYGFGAGMGALKATTWGSKSIAQIGLFEQQIGSFPAWTYKYTFDVTRAGLIEKGIGGYFGYETVRGGVEAQKQGDLNRYIGTVALTLPFVVIPYEAGSRVGMGYVQRKGAMSKLESIDRTRQQALYDMLDINEKLRESYISQKGVYDLGRVETITKDQLSGIPDYLGSVRGSYIDRAAIGGSTAMDIQLGEFFRGGGYPKRLLSIASERQMLSGSPGKPLRIGGGPIDVDVLLRGGLASESRASSLGGFLDTHVHVGRTGEYLGFGVGAKKSTTSWIYKGELPISVKTLSVREQFSRNIISSMPSNVKATGYRSFKDIPGMYDLYDVLQFQSGGGKLSSAMDRYLRPERYPVPSKTFGEKIVVRMGGAVEPAYVESGGYIQPVYPKSIYPNRYMSYGLAGGYSKNIMKTVSYNMPKQQSYKPPVIPSGIIPSYKPSKSKDIIPSYIPSVKPPTVINPPYTPPPSIPPSYTPPYTPPYIPPPTITSPPYNPPSYPTYIPPPIPSPRKTKTLLEEPRRKKTYKKKKHGKKYQYREFNIRDLLKDVGL